MRLKLLVLPLMYGSVPEGFTCLSKILVAIVVIKRYFASSAMSARWPCFPPHCHVLTALAATATWSSRMPYVTIVGPPMRLLTGLFHSFFLHELGNHFNVEVCGHVESVFCSVAALKLLYLKYLLVIAEHRVTH